MLHPSSDIPLVSGNSTALHLPLSVVKQSLFLSTPCEQTEAHTSAHFLPPDSGSHISFDCLRCPMGRKCLLNLQSGHCDVSHCRSRNVSPAKTLLYTDYPACIIPNGLKHITMLLHAFHQAKPLSGAFQRSYKCSRKKVTLSTTAKWCEIYPPWTAAAIQRINKCPSTNVARLLPAPWECFQ